VCRVANVLASGSEPIGGELLLPFLISFSRFFFLVRAVLALYPISLKLTPESLKCWEPMLLVVCFSVKLNIA